MFYCILSLAKPDIVWKTLRYPTLKKDITLFMIFILNKYLPPVLMLSRGKCLCGRRISCSSRRAEVQSSSAACLISAQIILSCSVIHLEWLFEIKSQDRLDCNGQRTHLQGLFCETSSHSRRCYSVAPGPVWMEFLSRKEPSFSWTSVSPRGTQFY